MAGENSDAFPHHKGRLTTWELVLQGLDVQCARPMQNAWDGIRVAQVQPAQRRQGHEFAADIRERIPIMRRHRLTPPPQEMYSLNRYVCQACFPRLVLCTTESRAMRSYWR
jgi:hypothetical protein